MSLTVAAWHLLLLHFATGLLLVSAGLFLASRLGGGHGWVVSAQRAGTWNLLLAAGVAVLAVLSGVAEAGARSVPQVWSLQRDIAFGAAAAGVVLAGWRLADLARRRPAGWRFVGALLVVAAALLVLVWYAARRLY